MPPHEYAPIRLMLVDDHPIVRDGLSRISELDEGISIAGYAATMQAAIQTAWDINPDVILMDVRLPDGDGITACRKIKQRSPHIRVLFLTSYADNQFVLAAMETGAEGYLLKESDTRQIVEAIRTIMQGGTVFDPVVTSHVLKEGQSRESNPLDLLTERERMVLAEVAKGRTDKEVAATLGLSNKTARNYLSHIFAKLNVHTRTEAALLYARSLGVLQSSGSGDPLGDSSR